MAFHPRPYTIKVLRALHIPGVQNGADFLTKALNRYEPSNACICLEWSR